LNQSDYKITKVLFISTKQDEQAFFQEEEEEEESNKQTSHSNKNTTTTRSSCSLMAVMEYVEPLLLLKTATNNLALAKQPRM